MVKRDMIKIPADQLSARKIGSCDGVNFSWNCNNYASLRPVKIEGKVFWLCGRCEQRIRLGAKVFIKKYGKKMWKRGVQL